MNETEKGRLRDIVPTSEICGVYGYTNNKEERSTRQTERENDRERERERYE